MMRVTYKKGKYIVYKEGKPFLKFDTEEEANAYIVPKTVISYKIYDQEELLGNKTTVGEEFTPFN